MLTVKHQFDTALAVLGVTTQPQDFSVVHHFEQSLLNRSHAMRAAIIIEANLRMRHTLREGAAFFP